MTKHMTAVFALIGLSVCMQGSAHAGDLVQNGGFETLTNGIGELGTNTVATGWTSTGYAFIFGPGTADTTGTPGQYGTVYLWGPGNGVSNGLTATSPAGGNFLGADGAYDVEPISQTINGLTVGQKYAVSFYWAAAQQYGYTTANTNQWQVSLGSDTQSTPVASIASEGFSGWQHQTLDYTATSTSEALSFLANGTPSGVPPIALLDGVSMEAVPEASSMVTLFISLVLLGGMMIRHSRTKKFVIVKSNQTMD